MNTFKTTGLGFLLTAMVATIGCNGASAPVPVGPEQDTPLGNPIVEIESGKYQALPFTVADPKTGTTHLTGRFTAAGGATSNIVAFVTDEAGMNSRKNGQKVTAFYNSGPVTDGNLDATLPAAGTYYLVYDDGYANDGTKQVENHAMIRFQPMGPGK